MMPANRHISQEGKNDPRMLRSDTRVDDNRPENFFVESKAGKKAVRNHRNNDAGKQAYQPGRKERPKDVERRSKPAACELGRDQQNGQNQRSLQTLHGFLSLSSRRLEFMEPGSNAGLESGRRCGRRDS